MKIGAKLLSGLLGISCLFAMFAGCAEDKTEIETYAVVYPEHTNTLFNNPDMGWIFYENAMPGHINQMLGIDYDLTNRQRSAEEINESAGHLFTDVAVMSCWGLIETEPGVFDWDLFDTAVQFWKSKGKKIHIRFATDLLWYSNIQIGAPEWIYEQKGVPYQVTDRWNAKGVKFPDYTNETYMECLRTMLNALAEKYRDDPAVVGVDLMGYGVWGEWHSGYDYDGNWEKRGEALRGIIDAYADAWGSDKHISISTSPETTYIIDSETMLAMGDTEFMKFQQVDYAMQYENISMRRNGLGGMVWELDGGALRQYQKSNKSAPLIYEFAAEPIAYNNPERALEEALEYGGNYLSIFEHSYIGINKYLADPDLYEPLYRRGQRELGYRFAADEIRYTDSVKSSGEMKIVSFWRNYGYGRAVKDYQLKWTLKRGDRIVSEYESDLFSARSILNGHSYRYEDVWSLPELEDGEYELYVSMHCDDEMIQLAMPEKAEDGLYFVGKVYRGQRSEGREFKYREYAISEDVETEQTGELYSKAIPVTKGASYNLSFDCEIINTQKTELNLNSGLIASIGDSEYYFAGDDGLKGTYQLHFTAEEDTVAFVLRSESAAHVKLGTLVLEETKPVPTQFKLYNGGGATMNGKEVRIFKSRESIADRQAAYSSYDGCEAETRLQGGACYTIQYNSRSIGRLGEGTLDGNIQYGRFYGGYYYVRIVNARTGNTVAEYKWHESEDFGKLNKSFSFITPATADEFKIVFGIQGPGEYYFSDFKVFENEGNIKAATAEERSE